MRAVATRLFLTGMLAGGGGLAAGAEAPDFARDIAPVLQERCFSCHGPDASKGGFQLHTQEDLLLGGDSEEPAVVAGNPGTSPLYLRIVTENLDERMPPKGAPLSAAQAEAIRAWIAAGALWDDAAMAQPVRPGSSHWAFRAPVQAPPPAAPEAYAAWVRNPIDALVLARMQAAGLSPAPEADRHTLIRRLSLDLTGLPPAPEAVAAFLADDAPDAYARLVEELLASPHYGERMAIGWLDIARFADTNGYEKDRFRSVWPYRDWVIRAFNDDKPFDTFAVEQLAGDLLPQATQDQRIATGFLRNSLYNEEGGVDVEEFRYEAMVDRTNTVATAFLGLTLSCAQCHDHKYDPFSQREYFEFFAFLDNTDNVTMPVHTPEIDAARAAIEAQIAAAIADLPNRFPADEPDTSYVPLTPVSAEAGEATLTIQDDASVLAAGPLPEKDRYALRFELAAGRYAGLRLEALTDASLPHAGPGRSPGGNFVLSTVAVRLLEAEVGGTRVALARAEADHEQAGYGVAGAIDEAAQTGWAIHAAEGSSNVDRAALFWFAAPLDLDVPASLEVVLRQDHGAQHTLGRFRVSAIRPRPAPTSELPEAERRAAHLARKFSAWLQEQQARAHDWAPLAPVTYASAKTATLERLDDRSVLVSGELPNVDTYTVSFRTEQRDIRALRLEALTHPSLPGGGPGHGVVMSPDGDFFLSELRVFAAPWDAPDARVPVALATPTASFSAPGREIGLALDGLADTGWSINGQQGQVHQAVFPLQEPLPGYAGGTLLTIELEHFYVHQHTLGRFRVSATNDGGEVAATGLPAEIEALLRRDPATLSEEETTQVRAQYLQAAPELAAARAEIAALRASLPAYPTQLVLAERGAPRTTYLRERGEFLRVAAPTSPGTAAVLHAFPEGWPRNRLSFAQWLTLPENPLLARVTVNRYWHQVFGRGLVETAEDFGTMGTPPTHPELLDWLAVEFMRRGWSVKELMRLIVTSAIYRQDSASTPEALERDPGNAWLARGARYRVDAEVVRDIALASSGLLVPKIGGPSVYPPVSPQILESLYTEGRDVWPTSTGDDRFRRGVYTAIKRMIPYPSATTFDMSPRDVTCTRRMRANTPLQALTLLNNSEFFVAAQALAARVLREAPGDDAARIAHAFMLVLARAPRPAEAALLADYLAEQRARFAAGGLDPAPVVEGYALAGVDTAEQAAWVGACRALLNLDEAISRT